jgi:hypothetical protein
MSTYARYMVVFERQLDGEDYVHQYGHPAIDNQEGIIQLAREIQEGFDAGFMDGTFLVIGRRETDEPMITTKGFDEDYPDRQIQDA